MIDILRTSPQVMSSEASTDEALIVGDYVAARRLLFDGINETYTNNPDTYHHLAFKAITLPYYQLTMEERTPELLKEAANVWGWMGDVIEREIEEMHYELYTRNTARSSEELTPETFIHEQFGRLSEYVIFGLLARDTNDESTSVPVPASRTDDLNGIDIFLLPIKGESDEPVQIQIKTKVQDADIVRYASDKTILIGLNELDKYYHSPLHILSLAQRFIGELHGTADENDIHMLNVATQKIRRRIRAASKKINSQ